MRGAKIEMKIVACSENITEIFALKSAIAFLGFWSIFCVREILQ
jgi:hypothetical protein